MTPLPENHRRTTAELRLRYSFAALAFQAKLAVYRDYFVCKFNENQPRVPAGDPRGGQWARAGGGAATQPGAAGAPDASVGDMPIGDAGSFSDWGTNLDQAVGADISLADASSRVGGMLAWDDVFGPALGEGDPAAVAPDGTPIELAAGENGRAPPQIRFGSIVENPTPAQFARFAATTAQANTAIRTVRDRFPEWKPEPGFYEGIEGAISYNRSIIEQAETRLIRSGSGPIESPPLHVGLLPGGREIGLRYPGAGAEIRTIERREFSGLLSSVMPGAREITPPENYPGQWYRRTDGTLVGLRYSQKNGLTLDIIERDDLFIHPNLKVHAR